MNCTLQIFYIHENSLFWGVFIVVGLFPDEIKPQSPQNICVFIWYIILNNLLCRSKLIGSVLSAANLNHSNVTHPNITKVKQPMKQMTITK